MSPNLQFSLATHPFAKGVVATLQEKGLVPQKSTVLRRPFSDSDALKKTIGFLYSPKAVQKISSRFSPTTKQDLEPWQQTRAGFFEFNQALMNGVASHDIPSNLLNIADLVYNFDPTLGEHETLGAINGYQISLIEYLTNIHPEKEQLKTTFGLSKLQLALHSSHSRAPERNGLFTDFAFFAGILAPLSLLGYGLFLPAGITASVTITLMVASTWIKSRSIANYYKLSEGKKIADPLALALAYDVDWPKRIKQLTDVAIKSFALNNPVHAVATMQQMQIHALSHTIAFSEAYHILNIALLLTLPPTLHHVKKEEHFSRISGTHRSWWWLPTFPEEIDFRQLPLCNEKYFRLYSRTNIGAQDKIYEGVRNFTYAAACDSADSLKPTAFNYVHMKNHEIEIHSLLAKIQSHSLKVFAKLASYRTNDAYIVAAESAMQIKRVIELIELHGFVALSEIPNEKYPTTFSEIRDIQWDIEGDINLIAWLQKEADMLTDDGKRAAERLSRKFAKVAEMRHNSRLLLGTLEALVIATNYAQISEETELFERMRASVAQQINFIKAKAEGSFDGWLELSPPEDGGGALAVKTTP